jgi:hypothetical protein
MPQSTPKRIVIHRLKLSASANKPHKVNPSGTASIAPSSGNTSHAKIPCTNQYDSQLHDLILLIGT